MDFDPQRKGSFVSGSGRLCQISSKLVQNCDCESTHTHTDRHTHTYTHTHTEITQVILLSVPCYAIAMGQIITNTQLELPTENRVKIEQRIGLRIAHLSSYISSTV